MSKECGPCLVGRELLRELCVLESGAEQAGVRRRSLRKAETLFMEGDTPADVFILRHGLVRLYRCVKAGRQATVRLVYPGELFGYTSLLGGEPYSLTAEAMRESELCVFSAATFTRTLDKDAAFTRGLLQRTAHELRTARLDLLTRSELDAAGKLAAQLLELDGHGAPLSPGQPAQEAVRITRTALGDMSGSAQETVSRVLGKLEASGLIERKGRGIFIRDKEGLRGLAEY